LIKTAEKFIHEINTFVSDSIIEDIVLESNEKTKNIFSGINYIDILSRVLQNVEVYPLLLNDFTFALENGCGNKIKYSDIRKSIFNSVKNIAVTTYNLSNNGKEYISSFDNNEITRHPFFDESNGSKDENNVIESSQNLKNLLLDLHCYRYKDVINQLVLDFFRKWIKSFRKEREKVIFTFSDIPLVRLIRHYYNQTHTHSENLIFDRKLNQLIISTKLDYYESERNYFENRKHNPNGYNYISL
jgi:hypothetical protein